MRAWPIRTVRHSPEDVRTELLEESRHLEFLCGAVGDEMWVGGTEPGVILWIQLSRSTTHQA